MLQNNFRVQSSKVATRPDDKVQISKSKTEQDTKLTTPNKPVENEQDASDKQPYISGDISPKSVKSAGSPNSGTASPQNKELQQNDQGNPPPLSDEQQRVIHLIELPQQAKQEEHIEYLYNYFNKFDFLKDMQKQKDEKSKQNRALQTSQKQQSRKA